MRMHPEEDAPVWVDCKPGLSGTGKKDTHGTAAESGRIPWVFLFAASLAALVCGSVKVALHFLEHECADLAAHFLAFQVGIHKVNAAVKA